MQLIAKILAVYMLVGSLFPRTDFSQLQKIPNLFTHYQTHLEEAKMAGVNTSFGNFLWQHFVTPNQHQHDDNSHQNLPFHSIDFSVHLLIDDHSMPKLAPVEQFARVVALHPDIESLGQAPPPFRPPIL